MAIFQFKDSTYTVSPPQEAAPSIENSSAVTTTYQQDITNLPARIISRSSSVNFSAIAYYTLGKAVAMAPIQAWDNVLLSDYKGFPIINWSESGNIDSGDALAILKVGAGVVDTDTAKVRTLVKRLEDNYEALKDVPFTSGYTGEQLFLFKHPPRELDDSDLTKHYIVVDSSDYVDRLKLVYYEQAEDAQGSYWYDAGDGSETVGLEDRVSPFSKKEATGALESYEVIFDASSSSVVNVNTDEITLPNHQFSTGDYVNYSTGILHTFNGSDSSIVDTTNNTITIPSHGLVDNDRVIYSFDLPGKAIGDLYHSSSYYVRKINNGSFKLSNTSDDTGIVSLGSVGTGFVHTISGVSMEGMPSVTKAAVLTHRQYRVEKIDANKIKLQKKTNQNVVDLTALGKGTQHKLYLDAKRYFEVDDKVIVSEEVSFHGVNGVASNQLNVPSHGYSTGDTTRYFKGASTNTEVGGLRDGALYYIIKVNDSTVKLATSAENAVAGTEIALTDGTGDSHSLRLNWGGSVLNFEKAKSSTIFTNNSSDIVFTNRTLKAPNWNLEAGRDVLIAKVYKTQVTAEVNGAVTDSDYVTLTTLSGGDISLGATVTGTGVAAGSKITSIIPSGGGLDITLSTGNMTLADEEVLTITNYISETLVSMDATALADDRDPKLSAQLKMNNQSISDGTNAVQSFVNESQTIASNANDTTVPTSAAVKALVENHNNIVYSTRTIRSQGGDLLIGTEDQNTGQTFPAGLYNNVILQYHMRNPDGSGGFNSVHEDRLEVTQEGIHIGTDFGGTYTAGGSMVNTDTGFGICAGNIITNAGYNNIAFGSNHELTSGTQANLASGYEQDFTNNSSNSIGVGASNVINSTESAGAIGRGIALTNADYSLGVGYETVINDIASFAGGVTNGDNGTKKVTVNSPSCVAFGSGPQIGSEAQNSQAFGARTRVGIYSDYSVTNVESSNSTALGYNSGVTAQNGLAGGDGSECASQSGMAFGQGATASWGDWNGNNQANFAFGLGTQTPVNPSNGAALGPGQFVVGKYNQNNTTSNTPHLFAVGRGSSDTSRSTAFCVADNQYYVRCGINKDNPSYHLHMGSNSAAKPSSSSWIVTSDERVKTNIRNYTQGLSEIIQLNPKLYDYNGKAYFEETKDNIGIIAQEILPIMPETVGRYMEKLNPEDEEETELYNFDSHAIPYALINAVKELKQEVDALKARVQELEGA